MRQVASVLEQIYFLWCFFIELNHRLLIVSLLYIYTHFSKTTFKVIWSQLFSNNYFHSMFMDTAEDERTKLISCLGAFRQLWMTLPQVRIQASVFTWNMLSVTVAFFILYKIFQWYIDNCFWMPGISRTVCAVDCSLHPWTAQPQEDFLSIRLHCNGSWKWTAAPQVHMKEESQEF